MGLVGKPAAISSNEGPFVAYTGGLDVIPGGTSSGVSRWAATSGAAAGGQLLDWYDVVQYAGGVPATYAFEPVGGPTVSVPSVVVGLGGTVVLDGSPQWLQVVPSGTDDVGAGAVDADGTCSPRFTCRDEHAVAKTTQRVTTIAIGLNRCRATIHMLLSTSRGHDVLERAPV